MYALRPATAAMIAAVGVRLFKGSIILALPKGFSEFFDIFYKIGEFVDIKAFVLFLFLFILSLKLKRDPLIYLLIGAIFGVLLHFRHILNLL